MTNKEQFIQKLHQARVNVIRWGGSVKLLSTDIPMKDYQFELSLLDTDFGHWFYAEASLITAVNSIDIIDSIEDILVEMYKNFLKIYNISVVERKKNFLGKAKNLSVLEKNVINDYYKEVILLSDEFQKTLRRFERIIQAKPEDEFTMFAHTIETKSFIDKNRESPKEDKKLDNMNIGGARGAYIR